MILTVYLLVEGRHGRDRMVVGNTNAYRH